MSGQPIETLPIVASRRPQAPQAVLPTPSRNVPGDAAGTKASASELCPSKAGSDAAKRADANRRTSAGGGYWRSLDEVAETKEFKDFLHREFPVGASELPANVSRRRWMQLMGASFSLAGVIGCRYQTEVIAPFTRRPSERVPGEPEKFATVVPVAGEAVPLLMTCVDGRPIKAEGHPDHPDSLGATTAITQAVLLELYDPDRTAPARTPTSVLGGRAVNVDQLLKGWAGELEASGGDSWAILAEPTVSPSVANLRRRLKERYPQLRWFDWTPVHRENVRQGLADVGVTGATIVPKLTDARVIVTLECDPLGSEPGSVVTARQWADGRDVDAHEDQWCNRLYSVESSYTITGMNADHRLAVSPSQVPGFVGALVRLVGDLLANPERARTYVAEQKAAGASRRELVLAAMVEDLVNNPGQSVVLAGPSLPPAVHAAVHRLNARLGNIGKTVEYLADPLADDTVTGRGLTGLDQFARQVEQGAIRHAIVLGGNPVYDAPQELGLAETLGKLVTSIRVGLYEDETSAACDNFVPMSHPFESWGDAITPRGVYSLAQPMIAPLHGTRSMLTILATLGGENVTDEQVGDTAALGELTDRRILRRTAGLDATTGAAAIQWDTAVRKGILDGRRAEPIDDIGPTEAINLADAAGDLSGEAWRLAEVPDASDVEVSFVPSRMIHDGRYANNAWLQEAPDPLTKHVWGNCALVHPATARKLGVSQNSRLRIDSQGGGSITLPVFLQPGQARGTITVQTGYGRTAAGHVGGSDKLGYEPVGVDVGPARSMRNWFVTSASVEPAGGSETVVTTQNHHAIDTASLQVLYRRIGNLVRDGQVVEYREFLKDPHAYLEAHGHGGGHHGDGHGSGPRDDHNATVGGGVGSRATPTTKNAETLSAAAARDAESGDHDGHNHDDHDHGGSAFHSGPGTHKTGEPQVDSHAPQFPPSPVHHPPLQSLWEEWQYPDKKWGMTIDLNRCIGCNGCLVACQAENNIPVVGKDMVEMNREMHWMRIDRYFKSPTAEHDDDGHNGHGSGEPHVQQSLQMLAGETDPATFDDEPEVISQPLTCVQCENAPCEQVCPVAATVHSDEGLNDMVYNRCIGTRFCGNNCPYKVRKFNYLYYRGEGHYNQGDKDLSTLILNPEVTVRIRGVMEKCTFCVQRIQNTRIQARSQGRDIGANEIQTACQQVCPTEAIVFGDLNNAEARVTANQHNPRSYGLLDELNTKPRLRYMSKLRNPHPALAVSKVAHSSDQTGVTTAS